MTKLRQEMDSFEFLRLQDEPCRHFSERKIHQLLMHNILAFMGCLERFYLAWASNGSMVEQPRKQLFTTEGLKGDLRVMPCVINRFEGALIKAVKVIGTNEEERLVTDKISVGKALLVDSTDNFVKGIFDVCALSSFRTAAISALAFKHSMPVTGMRVGIVGGGRVGFYTAKILSSWLGVEALSVADTDTGRVLELRKILDPVVVHPSTLPEICNECDALFLSTNASSPLFDSAHAGSVNFISSVGADADNLSELDASLLEGRTLLSESRQNIAFGDMHRWQADGLLDEEQIVELREVIGKSAISAQPVLFISTGTAVQDALVCNFLYDLA